MAATDLYSRLLQLPGISILCNTTFKNALRLGLGVEAVRQLWFSFFFLFSVIFVCLQGFWSCDSFSLSALLQL